MAGMAAPLSCALAVLDDDRVRRPFYRSQRELKAVTMSCGDPRGAVMTKRFLLALLAILLTGPALAAPTEAELMQAATELARQYDTNYAKQDPAGMASLYAADGVLVSPAGPLVRGRAALAEYYTKRFASGAHGHAIKVEEVHVQGEGGYGYAQFQVTVPEAGGSFREEHGSILAIYRHDPDGWHIAMLHPSVPPAAK
jgi:uncharacterized protein (TIGR02246 family)